MTKFEKRRIRSVLEATQLAIMAGSLLIGLIILILSVLFGEGALTLDSVGLFFMFFFFSLFMSFVVVNALVVLFVLPGYLLCPKSPSRLECTIKGMVGGLIAFAGLSLVVSGMRGFDFDFADKDLWTQGMIAGLPWFYWIVGPIYGGLVGLFTYELESGYSVGP